jgi:hypothetical protein
MAKRLSRRTDLVAKRLDIDPRLGDWQDACWVGRVFGLEPGAVMAEGLRLLAIIDASKGTSERVPDDAIVKRDLRLRPTRTAGEIQLLARQSPHRLSPLCLPGDLAPDDPPVDASLKLSADPRSPDV